MAARLASRVALITGSSSGLGRAMALKFASEGASVICADLGPNARAEIASEANATTHELIQERGGKAVFVEADVTDEGAVEAMVQKAVSEFGRIDM